MNGPLQRKTAIWVIFSKVVFFALLNGSWFQLHACEILESYEIDLLSKFRGKAMYKILIKSGSRAQRPAGRESNVFAIARPIVQAYVCSERSFSGHGQKTSFLPSATNSLTSLHR